MTTIDMDTIFAFLGGVSAKLYDDLHDNNMISPSIQELLKGSQWMLLTLLSHSDFNFTSINYIMNLLNATSNPEGYKPPYEKSLLILYPLLLLISYHTMKSFSLFDIVYILMLMIGMAVEPLIITEEFSYKKLCTRVILTINMCIGIYIGLKYGISTSIIKILMYMVGYFLVSSFFQAYLVYTNSSETTSSVKEDVQEQPSSSIPIDVEQSVEVDAEINRDHHKDGGPESLQECEEPPHEGSA